MPLSERVYCVAVEFKMTAWVEQQICIEFCIKLEHSSTKTIWIIEKAFRDNSMSAAQIQLWHKCYKDSQESVESNPHSGRPATSRTPENFEHVQAAINKDWQLTVWELEANLGILKITVSEILMQDLVMKYVKAKFVCVSCYQSRRNILLQLLMTWFKLLPMNQKVITGDEWWVYSYDLGMKAQSPQRKSPGSPYLKEQKNYSKIKNMLTVFFDWEGVVDH